VTPALSVVIPVYNEEAVLPALFERLYPVLDALNRPYEIVFVDDGSLDRSVALLRTQYEARPDVTRVVVLNGNFGQHMAILAAFQHTKGQCVVTLDADLQNPPEEIPVCSPRSTRGPTTSERSASTGRMRRGGDGVPAPERAPRAHHRNPHRRSGLHAARIRAHGRRPHQSLPRVEHVRSGAGLLVRTRSARDRGGARERAAGISKYSLYRLIRLNFD